MSLSGLKQVLQVDTAGTLVFQPPEGTPSSGTVTIYDEDGAVAQASAAGTVVGTTLTIAILAATVDDEDENYRAAWVYIVSGTTYRRNQLFDVAASIPLAPLSEAEFLERYPILTSRYPRGLSAFTVFRAQAWERLCQRLLLAGKAWRHIIDTTEFLAAQAHYCAGIVFENLAAGSPETDPWLARAQSAFAMAEQEMTARLANPGWYDNDDDLKPDRTESHQPASIELVR